MAPKEEAGAAVIYREHWRRSKFGGVGLEFSVKSKDFHKALDKMPSTTCLY